MRITCKALLLCRWPCLLLAIGIMDVNNYLPRIRLGTRIVSLLAMHCMEESWVEGSVGVMLAGPQIDADVDEADTQAAIMAMDTKGKLAKRSVGVMLAVKRELAK